jgi:molybdate transport repressor ModE-like protein
MLLKGRNKTMKMTCLEPPSCCVIAETEGGALGYRMAVLLDEIRRLGSLSRASMSAKIDLDHARELVAEMNESFRTPLVAFDKSTGDSDDVRLTRLGEDTVSWYWQEFGTVWQSILEERSKYC